MHLWLEHWFYWSLVYVLLFVLSTNEVNTFLNYHIAITNFNLKKFRQEVCFALHILVYKFGYRYTKALTQNINLGNQSWANKLWNNWSC